MRYMPAIDGMRALAVAAVVAYHYANSTGTGFVGVDVFFVISGYLISGLLIREWRDTGRLDLHAFYARRVRRLLPALVVVVVATLAAGYFLLSPIDEQRDAAWSGAAGLLFVANYFFEATTGGYFDSAAAPRPLLHLWSLSVEEQFYLLWPSLLLVSLRFKSARAVVLVLSIASFGAAHFWLATNAEAAFFRMPSRFWELAIGAAIALSAGRPTPSLVAYGGLGLILFSMVASNGTFPGIGAAPAVLGSAALLYGIHGESNMGLVGRLLKARPLVWVGLISYSLYLWHWPLLELARAQQSGPLPGGVRTGLCVLSVMLAYGTYRYVETPFRRWRLQAGRVQVLGVGVVISLTVFASASALAYFGDKGRVPNELALQAARDLPRRMAQCYYDDPLPEVIPRAGCANPGPVDVVILGDSFAFSWLPYARTLGNATALSRSACGPLIGFTAPKSGTRQPGCRRFMGEAIEYARTVDTVILAGYWRDYFNSPGHPAEHALGRTLDALSGVRRVILLAPVPTLPDAVPRCLQYELDCTIKRSSFISRTRLIRTSLAQLAATHPNVRVVDATDFFCTTTSCPPVRYGIPLYYDSHHVSAQAARKFGTVSATGG